MPPPLPFPSTRRQSLGDSSQAGTSMSSPFLYSPPPPWLYCASMCKQAGVSELTSPVKICPFSFFHCSRDIL